MTERVKRCFMYCGDDRCTCGAREEMAEVMARHNDPATAKGAADALTPDRLGQLQRTILASLRAIWPHGLTTFELAEAMNTDRDSVSPRMTAMVAAGLIADTGTTRTPEGRTRPSTVWRAVRDGDGLAPKSLQPTVDLRERFGEADTPSHVRAPAHTPARLRVDGPVNRELPPEKPPVALTEDEVRALTKRARGRVLHVVFRDGKPGLKRGPDGKTMSAWALKDLGLIRPGNTAVRD